MNKANNLSCVKKGSISITFTRETANDAGIKQNAMLMMIAAAKASRSYKMITFFQIEANTNTDINN